MAADAAFVDELTVIEEVVVAVSDRGSTKRVIYMSSQRKNPLQGRWETVGEARATILTHPSTSRSIVLQTLFVGHPYPCNGRESVSLEKGRSREVKK